ncbi:MAG TPA: GntR family transcriptional regulator [Chthoniobacteraceae bacterium]|nr:GntR family transcriptional regulator [Chthoniobacteraceae bacterium]
MSTSSLTSLRPSERVVAFLQTELNLQALPSGSRLPTIEELAVRLDVSEGTIKTAYRELAKKGIIESIRGRGSFRARKESETLPAEKRYTIGINLSEYPSTHGLSTWASRLCGGILKASHHWSSPVDLRLCGAKNRSQPEYAVESRMKGLDGVILFGFHEEARQWDAPAHEIPTVYMNQPSPACTVNFVSPDYFQCSLQLGQIWRKVGKKRVLFIGSPHPDQSVSVKERLGGLAAGLADAIGTQTELRVLISPDGSAETTYRIMGQMLAGTSWRPDAVYAPGDLMMEGILLALRENGVSVPDAVSLVGGNGTHATIGKEAPLSLASTTQPMELIGETLLIHLLQVIENGGNPLPGIFIPAPILPGQTVTEEENLLIKALTPRPIR